MGCKLTFVNEVIHQVSKDNIVSHHAGKADHVLLTVVQAKAVSIFHTRLGKLRSWFSRSGSQESHESD